MLAGLVSIKLVGWLKQFKSNLKHLQAVEWTVDSYETERNSLKFTLTWAELEVLMIPESGDGVMPNLLKLAKKINFETAPKTWNDIYSNHHPAK